jgi:hypothetical protein
MSKAQTDIRTTSYDELAARPFGYQGTIEDVLAQIRSEPDEQAQRVGARAELLSYLGTNKAPVDLSDDEDWSVEYRDPPEPGNKFSLQYAFDHGYIQAPQ